MILVTGGMGFIGLHTAKALLDAGEDVVLTRYRETRMPSFLAPHVDKRLFIETVDVLNGEAVTEAGRKHAVTGIVHLAGPPMHGPPAEGLRGNVQGLLNVLEAGSTLGVKRVMLASSIAIYAGVNADPWREDAPLPMASPYPMTAYKKIFEIVGDYYSTRTQMSVVSARISSYGPLQRGLYFLPARAAHAAAKGVPGPELAPGEAAPHADDTVDFAYVTDTAEAIAGLQMAPSLNHSIYNIGGGKSLSNREIADAVRKAVPGAKIELQPGRSNVPKYPALDLSRIKEDIGWAPRYTIDSGIAEYVSWLKAGNPY